MKGKNMTEIVDTEVTDSLPPDYNPKHDMTTVGEPDKFYVAGGYTNYSYTMFLGKFNISYVKQKITSNDTGDFLYVVSVSYNIMLNNQMFNALFVLTGVTPIENNEITQKVYDHFMTTNKKTV